LLWDELGDATGPFLDDVSKHCASLNLDFALAQIERIRSFCNPDTFPAEVGTALKELENRIEDELKRRTFFFVAPERAKYFETDPPPFGKAVQDRFPEAIADTEDASWCLGFGRSTAAVYHLMRVVECGVRRLRKRLKLQAHLERKSWGRMFGPMNAAIAALPYTSTQEINRRDRYSEAMAHLNNVKDAWRNPTMHSRRRYDLDEAEAIFGNVKAFMNFLAAEVFRR
jgi:hypothetical protein